MCLLSFLLLLYIELCAFCEFVLCVHKCISSLDAFSFCNGIRSDRLGCCCSDHQVLNHVNCDGQKERTEECIEKQKHVFHLFSFNFAVSKGIELVKYKYWIHEADRISISKRIEARIFIYFCFVFLFFFSFHLFLSCLPSGMGEY